MSKCVDFFGNEIEVGDEVAISYAWNRIVILPVTKIFDNGFIRSGSGTSASLVEARYTFLNTEKKHREKAVEYHAQHMSKDIG